MPQSLLEEIPAVGISIEGLYICAGDSFRGCLETVMIQVRE